MSRKSFFLAVAIVLLFGGGAGTALAFLVRHEPGFYQRAAQPPGPHRQECSAAFIGEFTRLIEGIVNKRQWYARFTAEQVNSYFAEDLLKEHNAERPLPEEIRDPRVEFETDRIRLGFRYGIGPWSTIVSIDLRVWLVAKEPNVLALEFQHVQAGSLPIAAQSMLERISEVAHEQNIDATWYRHKGHPVLLLRFDAYHSTPTYLIQQVRLESGQLIISGRSLDSSPPSAPADGGARP